MQVCHFRGILSGAPDAKFLQVSSLTHSLVCVRLRRSPVCGLDARRLNTATRNQARRKRGMRASGSLCLTRRHSLESAL